MIRFRDRKDAGKQLAARLMACKKHSGILVCGLPRGGVVVAYEVAHALEAPLEVFLVRKLGVPWQPELAMGALAEGGVILLNQGIITNLDIPESEIRKVVEKEKRELLRRCQLYRRHRDPLNVEGREIILVDDGLATGATMQAAVKALKKRGASRITAAVPVGDPDACHSLRSEVDDLFCLSMPHPLQAIGQWYDDFEQTSDKEVIDLLESARIQFSEDGNPKSEALKNEGDP